MPTSTKTGKGNPATKKQSARRFPRPGGTSQATQERSRFSRASAKSSAQSPSGLMGRAQATLPGRKAKGKKDAGVKGVLSSLGGASSGRSRKPSKKGMLGIVAIAGLGAAAMAKRRRDGSEDGAPAYPPVQPEADSVQSSTPAVPQAAGEPQPENEESSTPAA